MSEQWHYEQKGESYIKVDTLHKIRTLERELAAVTEQLKETRKHLKDANRGAEINAHALRINADKLIAVTEQRDRLADALKQIQGVGLVAVDAFDELDRIDEIVDEALQSLNQTTEP